MAITETVGPYGVMYHPRTYENTSGTNRNANCGLQTVTVPSLNRIHDFEQQNTNFRNVTKESPIIQNHPINNQSPKIIMPQADEKTRKEKKWSIGKLFRRKKKESDSSSESEDTISNKLESKRKRITKKNQVNNNYDQIVSNRAENRRAQSVTKTQSKEFIDEGILSDPSAGFVGFVGRGLPRLPQDAHLTSRDSLDKRGAGSSCGSQDGSLRKGRKGRMKARVEAIRNSLRHESSSDEESQKSSTSSSIMRFRSDDSLTNSRDGSFNKKSRSARTERYIKRLSRDEENLLNKEAELLKKGHSKSEIELIIRSKSTPNDYVNVAHLKKDHNNCYVNIDTKVENIKPPKLSSSISSVQSFSPASIKFNAKINDENVTYSIPYQNQNGSHSRRSYNTPISDAVSYNSLNSSYDNDNVMVVKFPIGGSGLIKHKEERAPPVPPRDPQRRLTTPVSAIYENSRYTPLAQNQIMRNHSHNDIPIRRPISSSEDHIAMHENYYLGKVPNIDRQQPRRPASVSAEPTKGYFQNHFTYRNSGENKRTTLPSNINNQTDLIYYADQTPRSRKPIHIRTSHSSLDQRYLSDSQSSLPHSEQMAANHPHIRPRNATEFWRKIDSEESQRRRINNLSRTKALSDQTNLNGLISPNNFVISPTYKPFPNNVVKPTACRIDLSGKSNLRKDNLRVATRDEVDKGDIFIYPEKISQNYSTTTVKPHIVHTRHKSESIVSGMKRLSSDDEKYDNRKSTNLDEALNELEAIYNSLGLGDEDLLERAEKREQMTPKFITDSFHPSYNGIPNVVIRPYMNSQHQIKRSSIPDKVNDDMAYRRFNFKENPNSKDMRRLSSNVSYMLASPVLNNQLSDDDKPSDAERPEPDVILDDVVYRNIKHAKNHLRVIEPQPPFGIPLGPISPSPQSDYLHANPENRHRPRFISRKSPDIVADDLAVRTLRKDGKPYPNDDDLDKILNGNTNRSSLNDKESLPNIKKKRAVRSLSANIFSMIQKEIDDALNMSRIATMERAQSITDLNKSLKEIILQNKNIEKPCEIETSSKVESKSKLAKPLFLKDFAISGTQPKVVSKPIRKYTREEFDQAIDVLAQETKDTSDKLGVALAELEHMDLSKLKVNTNANQKSNINQKEHSLSPIINHNGIDLNQNKSDLSKENNVAPILEQRTVKEICTEKKSLAAKSTEDSLLAISNQLHIVESKLKSNVEKKINFTDEKHKLDEIENKIKKTIDEKTSFPEERAQLDKINIKIQSTLVDLQEKVAAKNNSDNILVKSEERLVVAKDEPPKAPINNSEVVEVKFNFVNEKEKLEELTKAAEDYMKSQENSGSSFTHDKHNMEATSFCNDNKFKDLKNDISNIIHEISEVNDKLKIVNKIAGKSRSTQYNTNLIDENVEDNTETLEYNSSEELASIFNSAENASGLKDIQNDNEINSNKNNAVKSRCEGDLNSPSLVKSINNNLRRGSDCDSPQTSSACIPHQRQNSAPQSTNCVPWRKNRDHSNPGSSNGGDV